jgi:hypothetical protein
MRRTAQLVLWCLLGLCAAADPVVYPGLPPIPNPFGFDDRLALRTHLEEQLHLTGLAGKSEAELLAAYRLAVAAAATTAAGPAGEAERQRRDLIALRLRRDFKVDADPAASADDLARQLAEREAAEAARLRRDLIVLQLRRQYGVTVNEQASTDDLARQLASFVEADPIRARRDAESSATARADEPAAAGGPATTRPRGMTGPALVPLPADALANAGGVIAGLQVDQGGDRVVGICFNQELIADLRACVGFASAAMAQSDPARTCLILLGHGDGTHIGTVDLVSHLKANRDAYRRLFGVNEIDCVAVLSCSRRNDAQFLAFRDGLGYYPRWRVSAWENTYQTVLSGLGALQLVLEQDGRDDLRAVVYHGEETAVASLAEVRDRAAATYFSANVVVDFRTFLTALRRSRQGIQHSVDHFRRDRLVARVFNNTISPHIAA